MLAMARAEDGVLPGTPPLLACLHTHSIHNHLQASCWA